MINPLPTVIRDVIKCLNIANTSNIFVFISINSLSIIIADQSSKNYDMPLHFCTD